MIANTMPGNPAPLPRSMIVLACEGISGASWAESNRWRCQTSAMVEGATKFRR